MGLGIKVRPAEQGTFSPEALFNENVEWARSTAITLLCRRARTQPIEVRQDWCNDMIVDLWAVLSHYRPERGEWRGWAYIVMERSLSNLLRSEESRLRRQREQIRRASREQFATADIAQGALDSAMLSQISAQLEAMAQAQYLADMRVLKALALGGGDRGTITDLERATGGDKAAIARSRERIREAAVACGMGDGGGEG